MKKTAAGLLLSILFLLSLTIPALAGNAVLSVSETDCLPGETVTVPISLTNNPGLISMTVEVSFDSESLALIGVKDEGLIPGAMHSTAYQSPYTLSWVNDTSRTDFTAEGTLATLTFAVRDGAKPGEYDISLSIPQDGVLNTDVENVPYSLTSGSVNVGGDQTEPAEPDKPTEKPEKDPAEPKSESESKSESKDQSDAAGKTDGQQPETAAPQTEWQNPFRDVPETADYYDAVRFVYEHGLFNGVSATEFAPEKTMTRAMFVTVLGRLEQVDTTQFTAPSPFADVEADTWYTPYVAWAQENGIVKGYSAVKFGVNDPVTVEQAAVILARYADFRGIETTGAPELTEFADAANVSDWAQAQMRWAAANGIYSGRNGMLNPQSFAPRRLVAQMLASLAGVLENETNS